jgi:hypothetical protein
MSNPQNQVVLEFDVWDFSGAWSLELGFLFS